MVLWKSLSCVQLFATPWTRQSMEFSRQEYWSGLPFPSPGDLPNPGIKPRSPALLEGSLPAEPPGQPKNTRVGGLSLLQQIFPAQESHWGLLHCSQEQFFTSWDTREPPCQCEGHKRCRFYPWLGRIFWRKKWQPTPVFLPGKFHGQRSLVGLTQSMGSGESDVTERQTTHQHKKTWHHFEELI